MKKLTKHRIPRWARALMIVPAVLFLLAYLYFYGFGLLFLDSKGTGMTSQLIRIAQGSYADAPSKAYWIRNAQETNSDFVIEEFNWERPAPKSISRKPACSFFSSTGKVVEDAEYWICVMPSFWAGGPGCAWWRFEPCDVYEVDDFILTQPELFQRTLHALREPCVYLPKADDLRRAKEQGFLTRELLQWDHFFSCDDGVGRVPIKVVINVRNDQGDVIAQYIHLPLDPVTFSWSLDY